MWNSTIIPKSTSPLQRASPTESICKSPVDQTICENKTIVTDNKINHVKEEYVQKLLKDNKNNVCKNCSTDIREKRKNGIDKIGNQATNKEKSTSAKTLNKILVKQSVQSKTNSFVDRKTLNDCMICDSKNKIDVRNISRHTKECSHTNAVKLVDSNLSTEKQVYRSDKNVQLSSCTHCEFTQKELNVKDSKTDTKLLCNKNNIGLGKSEVKTKNEINVKVKKDNVRKSENVTTDKLSTRTSITQNISEKTIQVNCQTGKHPYEICNKLNKQITRIEEIL